jgi:hypothetical protein
VMGIGAVCVMLLSIGAGPAAAFNPCIDCDPGDGGGYTPPPPPSYSCLYDQETMTTVPSTGLGLTLPIQRATQKTVYAGWCSNVCPNASYKWQGPFGSYCECYSDTIPQLRAAGVGNGQIFNTRYAIWSQPAVANTRTLVIALAGQNGWSGTNAGGPGNVTGQPNNWDDVCNDWNCGWQSFGPASFVGRLLLAPGLNVNTSNTFAVSFLDHQYDWGSSYKTQIIRGLVDWLSTKVSLTYLKQIIIVGHSRGGCLSLGLTREFRARSAYNSVRILGAPVDGTCEDDGEMGTWSGGTNNIDNPLPGVPWDWNAWKSTFSTADNRSVCIQNTVGGEPQAGLLGIHSFHLANTPTWNNSWMNIPHVMSGVCTDNFISSVSNGVCLSGGNFHVARDVMDRALRFVERNRVP